MPRPNVIIIMADDLGFSDIAPFGGEIDTPALQKLADQGTRMSSFYVTPRCSPSRAAMLTGRNPHSVGIGVLTTDNRPNGYAGSLSTEVPTLAEHLKDRGYATGIFGKWHLASETKTPSETWPTRRGFDEFRGILPGATSYYRPPLMQGEERVADDQLDDDFFLTDDITASGVDFVRRHGATDHPYFLFMTYTAPHWPLHAAEEDIQKYRGRFAGGWDAARLERLRRLKVSGLLPEIDELPQGQPLPEWDEKNALWQTERMAVYAAQVENLDRGVGQILEAVSATDSEDDTIVLFFSDNGGCSEDLPVGMNYFAEDVAPRATRAGSVVHFGNDPAILPGAEDTYQSYGEEWATVSNTPFRKWKRWVHEGGISTPFIASWPNGGLAGGGSINRSLGHITDVVPTILAAVDALPESGALPAGTTGGGLDGRNLLTAWRDPDADIGDRTLYWEHVGNAALRRGALKLVREWGGKWELYDLSVDRTESVDLAIERPEVVALLAADYMRWAEEHDVMPWQDVLDDYAARGLHPMRAMG